MSNFDYLLDYEATLDQFNKGLGSSQYLFLIKKCCGYGFLFPFHKDASVSDLYKFIGYELKPSKPIGLFLNHESFLLKKQIPQVDISLRDYLKEPINKKIVKPVYKLPAPVVYELYLDDGYHNHNQCNIVL